MKRLFCLLLALLLTGCGQRTIAPSAVRERETPLPTMTGAPTETVSPAPATPAPTSTPWPILPTFEPQVAGEALFAEELLSEDGEPIVSWIYGLLGAEGLTKEAFLERFADIIRRVDELDKSAYALSSEGRTLTAARRDKTAYALMGLVDNDVMDGLKAAYAACPGEGAELPLGDYSASVCALLQDVQWMADRTAPFFSLHADGAKRYLSVLSRYMGEDVKPKEAFRALEELAQTEAYAIAAALEADPEAGRKREPISLGDFARNVAFLSNVAQALCPLPDGSDLPVPYGGAREEDMDLFELAYRLYPGLMYLKVYAACSSDELRARWENAPVGYLKGLAVHGSYAVVPYLHDFGVDYVQYRWYEEMLYMTMTAMSALLIHYYGYSRDSLTAYLGRWGAADYAGYLYESALSDPFDSLAAACGYARYLDICQAALDAGCESETRFWRDLLAVGPAPFGELKEYMVGLYEKQD